MRPVYEPTEMTQEFRKFDLDTPWQTFPAFQDASITSGYTIVQRPSDEQEASKGTDTKEAVAK